MHIDNADVTRARVHLTGNRDRYAYALGHLEALVALIARDHTPCATSGCRTCGHLREALAMSTAMDQVRQEVLR